MNMHIIIHMVQAVQSNMRQDSLTPPQVWVDVCFEWICQLPRSCSLTFCRHEYYALLCSHESFEAAVVCSFDVELMYTCVDGLYACIHCCHCHCQKICVERLLDKSTAKPCSGSLDVCDIVLIDYIDVCTQYAWVFQCLLWFKLLPLQGTMEKYKSLKCCLLCCKPDIAMNILRN